MRNHRFIVCVMQDLLRAPIDFWSIYGILISYLQSLVQDKAVSLLYALCFTLVFFTVAWVLYRKQIFVKL